MDLCIGPAPPAATGQTEILYVAVPLTCLIQFTFGLTGLILPLHSQEQGPRGCGEAQREKEGRAEKRPHQQVRPEEAGDAARLRSGHPPRVQVHRVCLRHAGHGRVQDAERWMNETKYRVSEGQMPRTRNTAKAARYLCVAIAVILHNLVIIANSGAARLVPERDRDQAAHARHSRIPVHPDPQKPARKVAEGTGSNTGCGRAALQVAALAFACKPSIAAATAPPIHHASRHCKMRHQTAGPARRQANSVPHTYLPSVRAVTCRRTDADPALQTGFAALPGRMLVGAPANPAKTCRLRGYIWFNWEPADQSVFRIHARDCAVPAVKVERGAGRNRIRPVLGLRGSMLLTRHNGAVSSCLARAGTRPACCFTFGKANARPGTAPRVILHLLLYLWYGKRPVRAGGAAGAGPRPYAGPAASRSRVVRALWPRPSLGGRTMRALGMGGRAEPDVVMIPSSWCGDAEGHATNGWHAHAAKRAGAQGRRPAGLDRTRGRAVLPEELPLPGAAGLPTHHARICPARSLQWSAAPCVRIGRRPRAVMLLSFLPSGPRPPGLAAWTSAIGRRAVRGKPGRRGDTTSDWSGQAAPELRPAVLD